MLFRSIQFGIHLESFKNCFHLKRHAEALLNLIFIKRNETEFNPPDNAYQWCLLATYYSFVSNLS